MAHAWSSDQALASAAHGVRARPRAWCRLRTERAVSGHAAAARVLLHHAAVPALLGARDHLRHLRRWAAAVQLPEADPIGSGSVPTRQQHEQHRRDHPRVPPPRSWTSNRGHWRRHWVELAAAGFEFILIIPLRPRSTVFPYTTVRKA